MKRIITGLLLGLCILGLCAGCTGPDGEIYGESDVKRYVDERCHEPYRLVKKVLIEETPDNMEYTFRTNGRDLTFQANSYLAPIYFDATKTGWYTREISCNYVDVVQEQYQSALNDLLQDADQYLHDYGWLYICDFNELETVIDLVLEADRIWKPESEYNPQQFLKDYPLTSFTVVWCPTYQAALDHSEWVTLDTISVTGQNTFDQLYEKLAEAYAQKVKDGEIPDTGTIPQAYLNQRHVSTLDRIMINGLELTYENRENPVGAASLITDHYQHCWYNEELGTYVIVTDIGYVSDISSFPMINQEYVKRLDGTYHGSFKEDIYKAQWSIGEDDWELETKYSDGVIESFTVEKNGYPLEIHYVTVYEDSNVGATYCIGIPADEFCHFFGLTCEIDEAHRQIDFYTK